jgi:hypothetical protein
VLRLKPLDAAILLLWAGWPLAGKTHSLNGCVKDEKGTPVQGVIVYVEEVEGGSRYTLATDAKGCYKQEGIPDGHFEVRAEWNGVTLARKQVALDKSGSVTADLQFSPKTNASAPTAPPMLDLKMLAASDKPGEGVQASSSSQSSLIESVTFQPEIANAGEPVMGTVALSQPAPADGVLLDVFVSNSTLASVPPEVTVVKGQSMASFPITTNRVRGRSDLRVTVKVSDGDGTRSAELQIRSYTRVRVIMTGSGYGRVVSIPEGISCASGMCSASFADGESVQLAAEPTAGTAFGGWSGDCDGAGKVVVTGPMTCTAEFR